MITLHCIIDPAEIKPVKKGAFKAPFFVQRGRSGGQFTVCPVTASLAVLFGVMIQRRKIPPFLLRFFICYTFSIRKARGEMKSHLCEKHRSDQKIKKIYRSN